jgi:hypothetical protein
MRNAPAYCSVAGIVFMHRPQESEKFDFDKFQPTGNLTKLFLFFVTDAAAE